MTAERLTRRDMGHLALIVAVILFFVWFAWDSWRASQQLENLMLVIPVCLTGGLTALYIGLDTIFRPGRSEPEGDTRTDRRIPLFMLAVCLFVAALAVSYFDVAAFIFLVATLYLLGERKSVMVLGFSVAMTIFAVYGLRLMVTVPVPTLLFGME